MFCEVEIERPAGRKMDESMHCKFDPNANLIRERRVWL
jgi:hypothetical protein